MRIEKAVTITLDALSIMSLTREVTANCLISVTISVLNDSSNDHNFLLLGFATHRPSGAGDHTRKNKVGRE